MKNKALVCTLLAFALTSAGSSFAQGRQPDYRNDGNRHEQDQRQDRYERRNPQAREFNRHDNQERAYNQERDDRRARQDGRGAGPDHRFYRGERMPAQYRSHQYVVNDWHSHRLSAPPRGYHWVQTGSDYVLVAIATGIILQLILSH